MKGQVWSDYVLVFAGMLLVAVGALAHVYKPSTDSIICATAYMRAQSEVARQEFLALTDYTVYLFKCKFDADPPEVNITCRCTDPDKVGGAVKKEFGNFGITPNVTVRKVSDK